MRNRRYIFLIVLIVFGCTQQPEKPNIVWICAEDITTMLGCYGDVNAHTPNLDAFAEKSVKFSNAYATAPVCAPSRSCIVTGEYATSLGTQHLRSDVSIPESVIPFPKLMREAGYYCTNYDKQDYNFTDTTIWNESSKNAHWKNRKPGQPFFAVFNIGITHQSGIFGDDETYQKRISKYVDKIQKVNPATLQIPPYFPESEEIRKLWARYYNNVQVMDLQFAERLTELENEGLLDNTIVFFFSDHGTGMPRAKRALYDSGLKIPLLVYVPEKYQKKFRMNPGTEENRMLSFLDFAPTVLGLAGIEKSENMNGQSFITTKDFPQKNYVFGTSDRVDEAYEVARTIRTEKFRYVRNFLSYTPLIQPNFYSDKSQIMKELSKFRNSEDLTQEQQILYVPKRKPEELYNVENDPHEVDNLAENPDYKEVLEDMRERLKWEMLESFDTGLMPEPEMMRLAENSTPYEITRNTELYPMEEILQTCNLATNENVSSNEIIEKLQHNNGFVRFWAVVAIQCLEKYEPEILIELEKLQKDDFKTVQIEASKTLIKAGNPEYVDKILLYLAGDDEIIQLYAARAFEETWKLLPEFPEQVHKIYASLQKSTEGKWYGHDLYAFWSLSQVFNDENVKAPEEVNYGK